MKQRKILAQGRKGEAGDKMKQIDKQGTQQEQRKTNRTEGGDVLIVVINTGGRY